MIQIGANRPPSFDDPLGLLVDCHRRIEYFLGVLGGAIRTNRRGPLNTEGRELLDRALGYFREGLPRHTEDEEESVFPRLRRAAKSADEDVLSHLTALEREHLEERQRVEKVLRRLELLVSGEVYAEGTLDELEDEVDLLREAFAAHIAREEQLVFPVAARLLGKDDLAAAGREMARRRGSAV